MARKKKLDANGLFDLMTRTEIQVEREERKTGKPRRMTLSGLRRDIEMLKQKGTL